MSTRSFTSMLMGLLLVVAGTVACEGEDELLGLAGAETAIAQETGEGPEGHLARLQERLELTAAQLAEIRAILEDQREKLRALGESAAEDRAARREAFREIREETHQRIGAVLTEEQRKRLEELVSSHGGHFDGRFRRPHGLGDLEQHLAKLRERLELTDAQVAEIRAILEDQREKLRALGESAPEDRAARREAFREIREETRDRIGAVLTEEQRQRLERMMRSHARSHGPRGGWHEED